MRLKTIGTGAILGKYRSACSLIDDNLLIDCGNGLVKTMIEQGININDIETVLITHTHADHILDLPFFIFTRNFQNPDKKATIYCPKGTEKMVEHICNEYVGDLPDSHVKWKTNGKVEFCEFETLEKHMVANGYYVTSYVVEHGRRKPAYGYTVSKDGKTIGFSGDSEYCESIEKIVENSDVSVLDTISPNDAVHPGHMGVNQIVKLCDKYNKKIVTTHMTEEAREDAISRNISNLIVPSDGDVITV